MGFDLIILPIKGNAVYYWLLMFIALFEFLVCCNNDICVYDILVF